MAGNRFTQRQDAVDEFPNEINEQEVISDVLSKEIPNDTLLKDGKLSL